MKYNKDQLINILENHAECATEKGEILEVLQGIYGNERGLIDFYAYYFSGNYKHDLMDIVQFLADEYNQTLKEFINTWLQE